MTTAAGVLDLFDMLAPVEPGELVGRWCGEELPTGSRLDGPLALHGLWGAAGAGVARLPLARLGFAVVRPLLRARPPGARVRAVAHRGAVTAAILYDTLPVVDVFRLVDEAALLGLMDMRGRDEPFAFVLTRGFPAGGTAAGR